MRTHSPPSCQLAVELLDDYLEGALHWADRERVAAHLRRCAGCSAYLAQLQQCIAWLGQVDRPTAGPATRQAWLDRFRTWHHGRTVRLESES